MKSIQNPVAILIFSLTLTACGGGSGDSGSSSSSYIVGGVVIGLNGTGLVLQNNGGDDLSIAGNSFEFPSTLNNGSSYLVTVKNHPVSQTCTVDNGSGVIYGNHVTNVTIRCNNSQLIESNTGGAGAHQIAVDDNGNALAVWSQYDGTQDSIWSNRYISGSGWGTAELIENNNTVPFGAANPQVAFDGNGNAIAVWQQYDGTTNSIWSNRYVVGSGWGTAEIIENDNAGTANNPLIAINAAGNAIVVWYQSDGPFPSIYSIWSNRYVVGSGWGTAELIETDNLNDARNPQIAIDTSGNALAVWSQNDGTEDSIWSNRYETGSGWSTPELIENDNSGHAHHSQIAIDANGNALVVWHQYDGARDNIWSNRYVSGSGWGTAELIENDNSGSAYNPQIAFDSNGNAIAVWQQSDADNKQNIWSNRYSSGSGWGTAELVEIDSSHNAGSPQIAIDASGNAIVVWQQSDVTSTNIWSNRYIAGSGWGIAEVIENSAAETEHPQIAIDPNGNALVVWKQDDEDTFTNWSIWSNRYVVGIGW